MSITQSDARQPQSLSRPMGERGDCILIARARPKVGITVEKTTTSKPLVNNAGS
jgi:hypothetical protein